MIKISISFISFNVIVTGVFNSSWVAKAKAHIKILGSVLISCVCQCRIIKPKATLLSAAIVVAGKATMYDVDQMMWIYGCSLNPQKWQSFFRRLAS